MASELILVIDDDAMVRKLVTGMLKQSEYQVLATGDPEEGLSLAREVSPDVVVLDIKMPRLNGFDLCQMIRGHQDTKNIPVIFMTALDDNMSRLCGFVSGGVCYLKKPFQPKELLIAIHTALATGVLEEIGP